MSLLCWGIGSFIIGAVSPALNEVLVIVNFFIGVDPLTKILNDDRTM
jgi:hypothetical protein